MRLLNLNMIAQSCYQILLILSKWRPSFEKISKIFQMWVSAQDAHSTDQRAQVLKVVVAELIKAKFQFQTIKNTWLLCISMCARVFAAHETDRPQDLCRATQSLSLSGFLWNQASPNLKRADVKDFLLNGVTPRPPPYTRVRTGNVTNAKRSLLSSFWDSPARSQSVYAFCKVQSFTGRGSSPEFRVFFIFSIYNWGSDRKRKSVEAPRDKHQRWRSTRAEVSQPAQPRHTQASSRKFPPKLRGLEYHKQRSS